MIGQPTQFLIQQLGSIDSIEWVDDPDGLPPTAVALAGHLKVHIPLAGLIDKDVELARLQKEIGKRRGDRDRAAAQLANERFTAKAPAAVVDKERNKLEQAERAINDLETQFSKLKTLD